MDAHGGKPAHKDPEPLAGDELTDEELGPVQGAGYLGPVHQDIIPPHDGS